MAILRNIAPLHLLIMCFAWSAVSFAQQKTAVSASEVSSVKAKIDKESKLGDDKKEFTIEVELTQSAFLSEPLDPKNQTNSYTNINPSLNWKSDNFHLDLRSIVAANEEGDNHIYFPESWYSYGDFTFGRKLEVWSHLDNDFKLGLWQPLFRWDHSRPVRMGLTGLFYKKSLNPYLHFTAFASPLFLPDQQPDYKIENGKMISGNRWVRNPIDSILFMQNSTALKYQIEEPAVSDVLLQNSAALKFEVGAELGPWMLASWSRKPNNQFHLGVDISESYDSRSDELYPKIYPVVVDQELVSFEMGYRSSEYAFYASVNQESFTRPELPEAYIETELMDSRYWGLSVEHSIPSLWRGAHKLIWSMYQRSHLSVEEAETRVEGEVSASTQRIEFQKWIGLDYRWQMILSSSRIIEAGLAYKYSAIDHGEWVSADIQWGIKKGLSAYALFDFFGADEDAIEPSFISYYSNNDRVQMGVKYAF